MSLLANANFAKTTLSGNVLIGATSLGVSGGTGALFPAANYVAVIWGAAFASPLSDTTREIVLVSARSVDTFTITRAQESTVAKAWSTSDNIALVITAGKMTELENAVSTLKQNLLTNSEIKVWSNATTVEVTSGAAPVDDGANAALVNNLLTNGGADSATTGWSGLNGTIASVAGGKAGNALEITRTSGSFQEVGQQVTGLTVGKLYRLSIWVKSGTSGNEAYYFGLYNLVGGTAYTYMLGTSSGSWVQNTLVWEATTTSAWINLGKSSATAGTMLFDSITLYEITDGCIAADTLGPDGWAKDTGLQLYREHQGTNTQNGSFYSLKAVTATSGLLYWNKNRNTEKSFIGGYLGRTVAIGAWVKTSTASKVRLQIDDGGATKTSSYHTGGGGWEWLEVSGTLATSITTLNVFILRVEGAATVYMSQPMLVYGSYIGQGNYAPIPGEWIYLEQSISSSAYSATEMSSGSSIINLEADTLGRLPKGAKAIHATITAKDSGSAGAASAYARLYGSSTNRTQIMSSVGGIANNANNFGSGIAACDSNGDITLNVLATGSNTAAVTILYDAVQVN